MVVVGAGISGVACARRLAAAGRPVRLVDRGHHLGGRLAVRIHDARAVDVGASYFTVRGPELSEVAEGWRRRGLARVWTDRFHSADASGLGETRPGPERWSATSGLRSLVEDLADGLAVERRTVETVGPGPHVDGEPAAYVVLAMPDPQARRLLGEHHRDVRAAASGSWEPSLALAAGWSERCWPQLDGCFVSDVEGVSWIADDGRRRGDGAPVLVAHSSPELARRHLDDPDGALATMLAGVQRVLGIGPPPDWTAVTRWTYAKPVDARPEPYFLSESGVGLCGDGWAAPSRVEAAYLSGLSLGDAIVERLGTG